MRGATKLILVALALALTLPACGRRDANEWIADASDGAVFIQWTRSDDSLTGTLVVARVEESREGDDVSYEVDTETAAFTGVVSGENVTLTLQQGFGFTSNWNGTLAGDELTLTFPTHDGPLTTLRFRPGSRDDYNAVVAELREAAAEAQAAFEEEQAAKAEQAAVAAQHRELEDLVTSVRTTLAEVTRTGRDANDALAGAPAALQTARDALGATRQALDAARSLPRGDEQCYAADEVAYAADEVTYAADEVGYVLADADAALRTDRDAIRRLNEGFDYLQDALLTAGYTPANAPTEAEVADAVVRANARIKEIRHAMADIRAQADAIVQEAKGFAKEARAAYC